MINLSTHPTGGYIVSAIVLKPDTREVFTDWDVYANCTKAEAKKLFRQHLAEKRYVLVNG
jgi:hypothetical protein